MAYRGIQGVRLISPGPGTTDPRRSERASYPPRHSGRYSHENPWFRSVTRRRRLHQHGDHPAKRITEAEADATQGTKAITLDAKTLGEYVGKYQLAPNAIFDVTLQGRQLYVKLATQPLLPVFASAKDTFFYRTVSAQIDFVRGADGKVEALVLHQHGADKRAPRLAH